MRKETALNRIEYKDLCDNSNELIQSVTPEGRFRYINNAWLRTLGYSKKQAARMTIFDIIHPDELEHCLELFTKVMSGKDIGLVSTAFLTRDGERIFVEGSVNCQFVNGKPTYTRAIFRDITERKKVEEERERMFKELEKALNEVKTLSGLFPICAWCKKIRDDKGYWEGVEQYIEQHTQAEFSHGVCPECKNKFFPADEET